MYVKNDSYRWSMRWLNRLAGIGVKLRLPTFSMEPEDMIREARRKTGLTELGDPRFREAMDRLFANITEKGNTALGKIGGHDMGVQACVNRLRLQDHLKRHPEIAKTKVERPVFILGFPRTGTTLIQNLLALSPDRRALPFWEIASPVPLYSDPVKDVAERQAMAKARLRVVDFFAPEMRYIHEVQFDSHEECWPILANSFTVVNWDMTCGWHEYVDWLMQTDLTWAYREYADFLRVMSSRVPDRRLVLKSPDHLWALDALLEVFPDACIVWTHRDPARSVPSYCSLASLNYRVQNGVVPREEMGQRVQQSFRLGIERAMAVRERVGEGQFFDVDFRKLLNDPRRVIDGITDHFNLTSVGHGDMDAYLNLERNDERGNHRYSAEDYGLSEEDIRAYFRNYIERFGL
jgi:hypothetical protein